MKTEFKQRKFKAIKNLGLTRGDYGVSIEGGHNTEDDPDGIYTFDPDWGDFFICSIDVGLITGDFEEIIED